MSAKILSGTETAKTIREELKQEITELREKHNVVPGLVTILVGEDPASEVYVGAKERTSKNLGIYSERYDMPADTSEEDLLALVDKCNKNDKLHGILVQLPLPKHINEANILYAIDPDKDVDGFHPVNIGKMMLGEKCFLPCTPHGMLEILKRNNIETSGKEVVVLGRSNIVGKPIANLMLQKREGGNATVTLCHTRTKDTAFHTKRADILIAAVGVPKMVTADMVKEGAVILDVGVNRIGKTAEGKSILAGDVDFEAVKDKVSAITPVPGGIGPMTITMLMMNTVQSAKSAAGLL
ncbi:MAG TPA: bifunctional methylenetetrahydrofolate dehydrogenase/methenyltetrahydrofolate cyclohydrolase FolD [Desulfobacterales bacterium]|nr:bifunctional methylenetetrahydrofolate dehydrogenase/methenyltetrahydrofolate cyclohydrolase FolD [Desulfobacterales bacterium]